MEAGKFSFKFSRQTQKNLVGSSKNAYFRRIGSNYVDVSEVSSNLVTMLVKSQIVVTILLTALTST
jgi:hypothetical protein